MASTFFDLFNLFPVQTTQIDRPPIEIQQSSNDIEFEAEILDAVNQHRTSLKLPTLKLVSEISRIAREHSSWMCDAEVWEGKICHTESDVRAERVRQFGFTEISETEISENVATAEVSEYRYRTVDSRQSTANLILAHWLKSVKGHQEAIEERKSTHTGIGVISCPVHDEDGTNGFRIYVTQLFARERKWYGR